MFNFLLVAAALFSRVRPQYGCFVDYQGQILVPIPEKIYSGDVLFSFLATGDVRIEKADDSATQIPIPFFIGLKNVSVHPAQYNFSIVSLENVTSLDDDKDLCANSSNWDFKLVCQPTSHTQIFIHFEVNYTKDHDPVINPNLRYQLRELVSNNTPFQDLKDIFTDRDCASPNSPLQSAFSIEGGNIDAAFRLASSSNLVVNRLISYQKETHFELNISVTTTQAFEGRTGFGKVYIDIIDIDDNDPVFDNPRYILRVQEENHTLVNQPTETVPRIFAFDQDRGVNDNVTYSINGSSNIVQIGNETGFVWATRVLDRETEPLFEVTVKANQVHNSWRSAVATLVVEVEDINDNRPMFSADTQSVFSIPEHSVKGSFIVRVLAIDADIGENANFSYTLGSAESVFNISTEILGDQTYGTVTVANSSALDRERISFVNITVSTVEHTPYQGGDCSSGMCSLNITIELTDINDNSPVFNKSSYTLTVRNNTKYAYVGKVHATDADEGINAEVRYQCLSAGVFGNDACSVTTINDTTGDIWLNQSLVSLQTHFALVEACDSPGDVSQTRCTTVPLRLNVSPNVTVSVTSYNFTIQENLPPETYVGEIQNYDEPFQLQDGHFKLDDKVLRTNASMDREEQDLYIFVINTNDQDNTNISVQVTVLDMNDNTPVFNESSYTLTVWDNTKNAHIGTVHATDADEGTNAEVRYQCLSIGFLGNDACSVTTINDTTGDIWLNQSLVSLQTHFALVEACDSPDDVSQKRCATVPLRFSLPANVTVSVTSYNFTIHENLPPETYLGEIQNYDEHFQLQNDEFQLDDKVLRTNVSLNREEQDLYIFVINTNDQDNTNISVQVTVLDVNDNTPAFNKSSYTLIVWDNTKDTRIGTVHATDADEGANAEVRYQCLSAGFLGIDACSVTTINDTTGDIWLNQSLVSLQTFFALVEACDSPDDVSQKRCATVPLRFSLPSNVTVSVTSYNFTIYENLPPEAYVGEIQNYDEHFQLQDGLFQLDNKVLRTKVSLDREEQQLHIFAINTNDQDNTNISVEVTVLDMNDNAPVFDPSNRSVRLIGSESQGQIITVVNATDDDEGVNAKITYSLQPQSMLQYFRINATSGVITLHTLPSSNMETMELLVKAADGGSPSLSGFYTLQINLPSAVRNGSAVIYASLASDKIKSDKDNIQSELGKILGVDVIITEIRQESADSSILYITARNTSSDHPLTSEELQSLVDAKPVEIADLFRQHDISVSSKQNSGDFTTPVIVLTAVGAVLLVALIVSIVIIARSRKSEKRHKRLIKSLSLSATIYDTADEEDKDTAAILGDMDDENNVEAVAIINPVFADDRGEKITLVDETEVTSAADTQSAPEGEDQDAYENASAERPPDADSGVPSDRENGQEDDDDDIENSSNDGESPLTKPRSATYLSAVLDEPLRGSANSHDLGAGDAVDVTSPETYVNLLDGLDGFPHPDESLSSPPLGDGLQAVAPDEPPVDFEEQASYVTFQDGETGTAAAAPLSNDETVLGTYLDPEVTSPDDMADTGSLDDFPVFPISARSTPPMVRKTREQRLEEELEPLPAEPLPDYGKKVRFNFQVTEHEVPEYSENDTGEDGAELPEDSETAGSNDCSDAPTTSSTTPTDDTPTGDFGSEAIGQDEQDVDMNQDEEITSF